MSSSAPRVIPLLVAALAAAVLGHWLLPDSAGDLDLRLPLPEVAGADQQPVDMTGTLIIGAGTAAADVPGAWPRFRGPARDARSPEGPLNKEFTGSLPRLWEVAVGEGYAGPVIRDGRVYLLDYDEQAREDLIRCMSLADGRDIWRRSYKVEVSRNHGHSRTVPALHDNYLVTFGPKCHVVCLDATTGEFLWGIDLVREHKSTVPPWYAGQCPFIDEDGVLVLGVGGESLVIAVEVATGKVLWKTPNPKKWQQTHVSITPMTFAGRKMYIYAGSGGVAGVDAKDGSILWETSDWRVSIAAIASPIVVDEDRLFLTGGYGAGAMMLRLADQGGRIIPSTVFRVKPDVFGAEQHTPILHEGHFYGVIPGGELACLSLDGKQLWRSGGRNRFGLGGYMLADGALWLLNDAGEMSVVEASPAGFRLLAKMEVFENGHDAWGPPALAGGRLIVRDMGRMACLDVRKP
jgi:outer membrane protein assembly factor BamB